MYISSMGAQNWAKDHPFVVCIHKGQETAYPIGTVALGMRIHFFYRQGKSIFILQIQLQRFYVANIIVDQRPISLIVCSVKKVESAYMPVVDLGAVKGTSTYVTFIIGIFKNVYIPTGDGLEFCWHA